MREDAHDFLEVLVEQARETIKRGYYEVVRGFNHETISLRDRIRKAVKNAVIAEIKPSSPSEGVLRGSLDVVAIAKEIEEGGATGISVLTEPVHFRGSISSIAEIRPHTSLPILMKDVIIDEVQVRAARVIGADAVLLIEKVFSERYVDADLNGLIRYAHEEGLEVLLEADSAEGLERALKSEADIIGMNSRDLSNLSLDLDRSVYALSKVGRLEKPIVAESGLKSRLDLERFKRVGVNAFLIGTSIMKSRDVASKVREFVEG